MHKWNGEHQVLENKTSAPHGDTLGLMCPLYNNYCICILIYVNSGMLILYGSFDTRENPSIKSIEKSISLLGGNSGISSTKTSLKSLNIT
jgi:hypothetical protein